MLDICIYDNILIILVHSFDSTKEIKKNSREKTVYDNKNVMESNNNEYIDSSSNNRPTSRILKQSKKILSKENDINSSTEKKRKVCLSNVYIKHYFLIIVCKIYL